MTRWFTHLALTALLFAPLAPAKTPAPARDRLVWIVLPNGARPAHWRPTSEGQLTTWPEPLAPLQPLQSQITVLSGVSALRGATGTFDPIAHRASAVLTARSLQAEVEDAPSSVDQRVGAAWAGLAPRDAMALSSATTPRCIDTLPAETCAQRGVYSYDGGQPANLWQDPAQLWAELAGVQPPATVPPTTWNLLLADADRVRSLLGATDRRRVDRYLGALDDLSDAPDTTSPSACADLAGPEAAGWAVDTRTLSTVEHRRRMLHLGATALACGHTRVLTYAFDHEGSRRPAPHLGIDRPHHLLAQATDAEADDAVADLLSDQLSAVAVFLQQLADARDPDGVAVLDRTTVVIMTAAADLRPHDSPQGLSAAVSPLMVLIAGGAEHGVFPQGEHRIVQGASLADLHRTVSRSVGVALPGFGDDFNGLLTFDAAPTPAPTP